MENINFNVLNFAVAAMAVYFTTSSIVIVYAIYKILPAKNYQKDEEYSDNSREEDVEEDEEYSDNSEEDVEEDEEYSDNSEG